MGRESALFAPRVTAMIKMTKRSANHRQLTQHVRMDGSVRATIANLVRNDAVPVLVGQRLTAPDVPLIRVNH